MGRLGTPEDLTGASPGAQTQDTSLGVCMSWCADFEFRVTQARSSTCAPTKPPPSSPAL